MSSKMIAHYALDGKKSIYFYPRFKIPRKCLEAYPDGIGERSKEPQLLIQENYVCGCDPRTHNHPLTTWLLGQLN